MSETASIIREEVIWGLHAIGDRVGISNVEAYRRLVSGRLPGERIAGRWAARAADLEAHVSARKRAAA